MKSNRRAWLLATLALAAGCAGQSLTTSNGADGVATVKVSGAAQDLSVCRAGPFDLDVSGDGHTIRIPPGNAVRRLRVSGVNHVITVADGASVHSIRLAGVGSTVYLPKGVHPTVSGNGVGGRVLNDVERTVSPPANAEYPRSMSCVSS